MMMASGLGIWYGYRDSNAAVLTDLLKDDYDFDITPDQQASGEYDTPNSPVAELPTTLFDLHCSSASDMPFDPLHWDSEGNYIP